MSDDRDPPEELRALCALSDVHIEYVRGRPGRTWRLTYPSNYSKSVTLQTTQLEDWMDAVKTLIT